VALDTHYMLDVRPTWVNAAQSANWEAAVRQDITRIAGPAAGRALLSSIRFWGKWVSISPYDFSEGKCNAYATDRSGMAKDGHPYGAFVLYSPHIFQAHSSCVPVDPGLNMNGLPHEILFHELVHAFRRVSGKRAWAETGGGLIDYDSNEEFIAILCTNIFVTDPSNRKATGLRRDHQDGAPMDAALAGSFEFFESSMDTFDLVKKLTTDHPGLTGALAKVPSGFNPLAAFFKNPAEAQRRSRSARAVVRDADGWLTAFGRAVAKFLP
jgi:Effector protein